MAPAEARCYTAPVPALPSGPEAALTLTAAAGRLALERLLAALVTLVAGFLFLNGSFFSSYGAHHIDLSINLTAAHALRQGENPYGATTLAERAKDLGSPTELIYSQLFTSYIQPPTSALHLVPLSFLPWRQATHVYLVLNHALLLAAVALSLRTLRPSLPTRWLVAGSAVILMLFSQIYMSFALGQVDATLCLLLAVGFWGYVERRPAVTGTALALGAAIKLIPGLLLLYFLWKREYRVVAWGAGVGMALLLLSLAYTGPHVYETYLTETLPALSKGSTQYSNVSLGGLIARLTSPEVIRGLPELYSLDEVPGTTAGRLASLAVGLGALLSVALVTGRGGAAIAPPVRSRLFCEYYLVVCVALIISSVTWEFYVIWLLPVFLAGLLAPGWLLPAQPAAKRDRRRWVLFGFFALLLLALNLPGDFYLFGPNHFFYRPDWVPGTWAEVRLRLYHNHLDAVILLRLPALLLLAGALACLVVLHRRQDGRLNPTQAAAAADA